MNHDDYKFTSVDEFIKSNKPFPLKRHWFTDKEINGMFKKLQKYDYRKRLTSNQSYTIRNLNIHKLHLLFIGHPLLLEHYPKDYNDFEQLSDMFQEKERMKCRVTTNLSPYEFYKNIENKKKIATYCLQKYKLITPFNIRESIYNLTKECTSFKPQNIVAIIKFFNSKSVLDISAGWGDRLIGSMACGVEYFGTDPNSNLFPNYNKMIEFFKYPKNKITIVNSPFEDAKIPKNRKFDLIFTSPPYYDLEKYTNQNTQSIARYPSEDKWFTGFLTPAIKKAWSHLNEDGYMVLVINQKQKQETYIQRMIDFVYNSIPNSHYYGVISYTKKDNPLKNPQPMFIWRKNSKNVPNELYNPPVIITPIKYKSKTFNVFRDDFLIGGTKQRGVVPFLEKTRQIEYVYSGPVYGYAQIALAYGAKLARKRGVLFLEKKEPRHPFTSYADSFGSVDIHEFPPPDNHLKAIQKKGEDYVKSKSPNTTLNIPFGLYDPLYNQIFCDNIKKALPQSVLTSPPKRIWLVVGSGTVLRILTKIFPDSEFHVVQVGKKVWDDQIEYENSKGDKKKAKLYISPQRFQNVAHKQPPYPTVKTYDAKLWYFVEQFGESGDYIWNVGGDIDF